MSVIEIIRERGVLKVGTTLDYKPMSFIDPETGRYVGNVMTGTMMTKAAQAGTAAESLPWLREGLASGMDIPLSCKLADLELHHLYSKNSH